MILQKLKCSDGFSNFFRQVWQELHNPTRFGCWDSRSFLLGATVVHQCPGAVIEANKFTAILAIKPEVTPIIISTVVPPRILF